MKTLCTDYQYSPRSSRRERRVFEKKPLADVLKAAYKANYYESGRLETHIGIQSGQRVKIIKYKDLSETEVEGYPYAIDYDKDGELQCHFPLGVPNAHELVIGSTGSGKTTSLVDPRIRVLSSKKNKASLFLSDPKGELFQKHAEHLKRQGYQIYLLNFKNVSCSDSWNPLVEIYDVWMRQADLKDSFKRISGREYLAEYKLQDDPASYSDTFWSCGGRAFSTVKSAKHWYEEQVAGILTETADLIHQLVYAFIPDNMISKSDPSWMLGARDILSAILYLMLEDALDERSGFTRSNMNLLNVQEYFERIRSAAVRPEGNIALLSTAKLMHKSDQDLSIKLLRTYLENAPNTTRSYIGVYRNAMQEWFNSKIFTITNGMTIDLDTKGRPLAIFLITRDCERSDFVIASMFIDWVYRKLLEQADQNGGSLEHEFYFILEEFFSIPMIRDFTNKITAARSRNIAFHIILQSYAQLSEVYGPSAAQTVIDNCDCVFLGSKNYETKEKFARECGRQTIPSLESVLNPAIDRQVEVPIMTVSRLENLRLGQMYMRRTGMPLLLTECEISFRCSELRPERNVTPEEMGIESLPYNSAQYRYLYLETDQSMEEYYRARNHFKQPFAIESDSWREILK